MKCNQTQSTIKTIKRVKNHETKHKDREDNQQPQEQTNTTTREHNQKQYHIQTVNIKYKRQHINKSIKH